MFKLGVMLGTIVSEISDDKRTVKSHLSGLTRIASY